MGDFLWAEPLSPLSAFPAEAEGEGGNEADFRNEAREADRRQPRIQEPRYTEWQWFLFALLAFTIIGWRIKTAKRAIDNALDPKNGSSVRQHDQRAAE
jgi:hypothetical protein